MPMAAMMWSRMILMILLVNGGSRDLLDCLSVQDYWQAKSVPVNVENMTMEIAITKDQKVQDISALIKDLGSDEYETRETATKKIRAMGSGVVPQLKEKGLTSTEPEVIDRARKIIENFTTGIKAKEIRKLMALRALGELKNPQAIPALQALLASSKDPFVIDYTQAAIAAIAGKTYHRTVATPIQMGADLNTLPPGLGVVAQQRFEGSATGLIDTIMAQNMGAAFPPEAKQQALDQGNKQVIEVAEKLGNIRVDSITVGVSKDIGNNAGFVAILARGNFDPAALAEIIGTNLKAETIAGIPAYTRENAALFVPSGQRIALYVGPAHANLPLQEIAAALGHTPNKFAQDPDLVKLVASVDTTKPLWLAMKVPDTIRQVPTFQPFDSIVGVVDRKGDRQQFTLTATGADAIAVKAGVDGLNTNIAAAIQQMQKMQGMMPEMASTFKGMLSFLTALKCQANGTTATLTGTLEDLQFASAFGAFAMRAPAVRVHQAQPMPPQAVPARIQPAPATAPASAPATTP